MIGMRLRTELIKQGLDFKKDVKKVLVNRLTPLGQTRPFVYKMLSLTMEGFNSTINLPRRLNMILGMLYV